MAMYRKYLEPKYGEKAKDVIIPPAEDFDLSNPTVARKKFLFESFVSIYNLVSKAACYDDIMTVPTQDVRVRAGDGHELTVRIYTPDGEGPHPCFYWVHGGGWINNDLTIYEFVCRYLCKFSGAVVFAVDYRLAPEYRFPIGIEDCYTVMEWIAEHAAEYGADPATLMVSGDSAGGNLTAALALMARDRKGPSIKKQMMVFPATTFILDEPTYSMERYGRGGYFLNYADAKSSLIDVYFSDPADAYSPYASPLLCDDLKDLPDAYLYSAECDPLLDQGLMYMAKLQDSGVKTEVNIYEGMIHGFINRAHQKTYECLDKMCEDINK